MGWDGSGNYTRQRNFSADASAGVKFNASAMDQELDDFASAMENTLTRDGQNAMSANLDLGGFEVVNAGTPSSAQSYIRAIDSITDVPIFVEASTDGSIVYASTDFYATVSAAAAPPNGARLRLQLKGNITGAATIRLNSADGVGAYSAPIYMPDGKRTVGGVMISGATYDLVMQSAMGGYQLINPSHSLYQHVGDGVWKSRDVATGVTGVGGAMQISYAINGDQITLQLDNGPLEISASTSATVDWILSISVSALPAHLHNSVPTFWSQPFFVQVSGAATTDSIPVQARLIAGGQTVEMRRLFSANWASATKFGLQDQPIILFKK